MTDVEIEYCVPCGHRDTAQEVQTALLEQFGQELDSVALVTGDGGVFKIRVDGDLVFDKAEDEFDVDGIVDSVGDAHAASA
jgi:selenoprotein W-related protein